MRIGRMNGEISLLCQPFLCLLICTSATARAAHWRGEAGGEGWVGALAYGGVQGWQLSGGPRQAP